MAKKSQIQKFREAARAAGTDDFEERFNATLKGLAKTKRKAKSQEDKSLNDLAKEPGRRSGAVPIGNKIALLMQFATAGNSEV